MTTLISREKLRKINPENGAMTSREKLRKIYRENDSICIFKLLTNLISRNKIVDFSNGKNRENDANLNLIADNFDFTKKNVEIL